ncbi:hypothetical protein V8G54_006704 [Vigna mungo]|uniref:Uncharacterized protein n=1 Tax=Vigna mungo TaxID=3915 RepID=A0AAQ3S6N9_VIGMU
MGISKTSTEVTDNSNSNSNSSNSNSSTQTETDNHISIPAPYAEGEKLLVNHCNHLYIAKVTFFFFFFFSFTPNFKSIILETHVFALFKRLGKLSTTTLKAGNFSFIMM